MSSLDWAALRQGGAVALVVAVPCSIAATWLGSQEDDSAWTILFVLGALAGFTLGAGIAARTSSKMRGSASHGAAISIVSTTRPLRVSACNALVSLR